MTRYILRLASFTPVVSVLLADISIVDLANVVGGGIAAGAAGIWSLHSVGSFMWVSSSSSVRVTEFNSGGVELHSLW